MDVTEAIRLKRAVRDFAPVPLPNDVVQRILWAGRRAQSSRNSQPWRFIAIRDRKTLKDLPRLGEYAGHLAGAALGVIIVTPDPAERWGILFDAGQAAAYMQLAAWELGIASCIATIHETEAARALLGFPNEWHLRAALSFGYPADSAVLAAAPRAGGRRPPDEMFHHERWVTDPQGGETQ